MGALSYSTSITWKMQAAAPMVGVSRMQTCRLLCMGIPTDLYLLPTYYPRMWYKKASNRIVVYSS